MSALYEFDRPYYQAGPFVIGVDEAGRGPLAGPVVAAACHLPASFRLDELNDSKQLSEKKRNEIFQALTQDSQVIFATGWASVQEIDQINIYQATKLAMMRALKSIEFSSAVILVDAMPLDVVGSSVHSIIRGDSLSQSIAAASIIAKVCRDRYMCNLDKECPGYGFAVHKGYPTAKHKTALKQLGASQHHRKSFSPVKALYISESKLS